MELLILGVLIGAGAAKRKSVTKALVKGYLAVKETSTHMKEDLKDAIREAKSEQDTERIEPDSANQDTNAEITALHEEATSDISVGIPTLKVIETSQADATADDDSQAASTEVSEDETAGQKPSLTLLKGVAKSFLKVSEMTRSAAAHVREDLRDAVEEARYERELAAAKRTNGAAPDSEASETAAPAEPIAAAQPPAAKKPTPRKSPATAAPRAASKATTQKDGAASKAVTASAKKAPARQPRVPKTAPKAGAAAPSASAE